MNVDCRALTIAFVSLLVSSVRAADAPGIVVGNASEFALAVDVGRRGVALLPIAARQGCGPGGCVVQLGSVTVLRDHGGFRSADGKAIRLIQHAPGLPRDLPALNWDPLRAFDVARGGVGWGTCVEFAHAGVGSSGSYQRWRSVVLIPRNDRGSSVPVAHRFVGYWASCEQLTDGDADGEIALPLVEPRAMREPQLRLTRQRCTANGCRSTIEARTVVRQPGSETGALVLGPP